MRATALGSFEVFGVGATAAWEPGPHALGENLRLGGLLGLTIGARGGVPYTGGSGRFRLDMLADIGAHFIHVGADGGGGTSAGTVIPYVGVRVGPAVILGRSDRRPFFIGLWLGKNWDFYSKTLAYTYLGSDCGEYGDIPCSPEPRSATVGGDAFDLGIRFGGEID